MGQHDQSTSFSGDNICLTGLMGSGKSKVGRLLARQLGCPHIDLDLEIAQSLGCSIPEIFEQYGEEHFRREESNQLERFCRQSAQVISCGGGIVLAPSNRALLRRQRTVYLEASVDTLAQRVGAGKGRPLLKGVTSMTRQLAAILKVREPLYRECARITVTTDNTASPQAVVDTLMQALSRLEDTGPS